MYFYIFISFRNHFSLFNLSGDTDKIKYSKHKDHKFVCASEYAHVPIIYNFFPKKIYIIPQYSKCKTFDPSLKFDFQF